jgi:hypothetical protein
MRLQEQRRKRGGQQQDGLRLFFMLGLYSLQLQFLPLTNRF